jgi:hypothetical protein
MVATATIAEISPMFTPLREVFISPLPSRLGGA